LIRMSQFLLADNVSVFAENVSVFAANVSVFAVNVSVFADNVSVLLRMSQFLLADNVSVFAENVSVFAVNVSVFAVNVSVFADNVSVLLRMSQFLLRMSQYISKKAYIVVGYRQAGGALPVDWANYPLLKNGVPPPHSTHPPKLGTTPIYEEQEQSPRVKTYWHPIF
jgi:hypothetical protein